MKKTYESTIDEAVNASFRIAEMAGTVQKQLWYGFIWILIIPPLVYLLFNRPYYPRLAMPLVFAVVLTAVHLLTYRDQMRKRIRKFLVKALGADQPVRSEYEINEDGLAFRKMGQEVRFSWSNVTDIIKTTHSIEVHMKPLGIAILPKRIFESDQELQDWLSFIENHRGSNQVLLGTARKLAARED